MAKKQTTENTDHKPKKPPTGKVKSDTEISKLKAEIEQLNEKVKEADDKYLRLAAEFDNYRKRTLKEKIELTKHGGSEIFISILPVIDDFDRAMQVIDSSKDITAMKQGIELIYNKFHEFLAQNGVKEIESKNKEFNTDLHEAITKVPVTDAEMKGKVIDIISKGYMLNEKIIRFPKVVVGN